MVLKDTKEMSKQDMTFAKVNQRSKTISVNHWLSTSYLPNKL